MTPAVGGQGIPNLEDLIHKQKFACMNRILAHNSVAKDAGEAMIERTFRQIDQSVDARYNILDKGNMQYAKNWFASAIEWVLCLDGSDVHVHNNIPEGPELLPIKNYIKNSRSDEHEAELEEGLLDEMLRADVRTIIDITAAKQGQTQRQYVINPELSLYLKVASLPPIINQAITVRLGGMYMRRGYALRVYEFMGALPDGQAVMKEWELVESHTYEGNELVAKIMVRKGDLIRAMQCEGKSSIVYVDNDSAQHLYVRCHVRLADNKRYLGIDAMTRETLKLPDTPIFFTRNTTSPIRAQPCEVYTDGAFKWLQTKRQRMFLMTTEGKQVAASAGAVIYQQGCVQQILMVTIQQQYIVMINPYIVEAIGVLAVLYKSSKYLRAATIWLDCKALVQSICAYKQQQSKGASQHMSNCPYVAAIFRLGFGLGIEYRWVKSHVERRNTNSNSWTNQERGNYTADLAADGDPLKIPEELRDRIVMMDIGELKDTLRTSTRYTVLVNGFPVGFKQRDNLMRRQYECKYLNRRQNKAASGDNIDWRTLSIRLSAKILANIRAPVVIRTKLIYNKYDTDDYKADKYCKMCQLCSKDLNYATMDENQRIQHADCKDTIGHLFWCKSDDATKIREATLQQYARTPCSKEHMSIVGNKAEQLKACLLDMARTSDKVRIGLFDKRQQEQLIATLGQGCSDTIISRAKNDIINLTAIFAEATVQLIHIRNATNNKTVKKRNKDLSLRIFKPRASKPVETSNRYSVLQQLGGGVQQPQNSSGGGSSSSAASQSEEETAAAEVKRRREKDKAQEKAASALKVKAKAELKRKAAADERQRQLMIGQKTIEQAHQDKERAKQTSNSSSGNGSSSGNQQGKSAATAIEEADDKAIRLPRVFIEPPDDQQLAAILAKNDNTLAVRIPSIAHCNLYRLNEGIMLNDIIIDEYCAILSKNHSDSGGRKAHVCSHLFMENLEKNQYQEAYKYAPKTNIFQLHNEIELLLVIVKLPGHWIFVEADITEKTVCVMDPLEGSDDNYLEYGERVFDFIQKQHEQQYGIGMTHTELREWSIYHAKRDENIYSHQCNGIDCGVCVLQYCYASLMGTRLLFGLQQTNEFRKIIARSLLINKIIMVPAYVQSSSGGQGVGQQAPPQDRVLKLPAGSKSVTVNYLAVDSSDRYLKKAIKPGQDICAQFGRVTQQQKKDHQSYLIYVQQEEWCRKLVHGTSSTYNKANSIMPTELKNNMQLLVLPEQPQAPLGPPLLLSMQMRTRGQCILQGIRIVRGQGDCLYRALVYGILEQIILSTTAVSRMAEFRKYLREGIEHVPQSARKDRLERGIALLTTGRGELCVDIHSLTVQVAQELNGVDKALIEIMREIVHQYVSENGQYHYGDGEFTVQQQMELADERKRTFEEQLQGILTMGEEASDQLVNMGLAFQALRVQCDLLVPTPTGLG